MMSSDNLNEVVLRSLEHERTGIAVYKTALRCATSAELRREWDENLAKTRRNERMLTEVCDVMDIDPDEETLDRRIVRQVGDFLVDRMHQALASASAEAAELIACECVVLAEARRYEETLTPPAKSNGRPRVRHTVAHHCAELRPQRSG